MFINKSFQAGWDLFPPFFSKDLRSSSKRPTIPQHALYSGRASSGVGDWFRCPDPGSLNAMALEIAVLGRVAEALAAVTLHQIWAVICLPRDAVVEDHPDFTEPPGIFSGRHKD